MSTLTVIPSDRVEFAPSSVGTVHVDLSGRRRAYVVAFAFPEVPTYGYLGRAPYAPCEGLVGDRTRADTFATLSDARAALAAVRPALRPFAFVALDITEAR